MRVRNHGKYTNMSKRNPRAIGRCDYSGLMVAHSSLQRQLEYRGNGLVWTGYWVSSRFLDVPNCQNMNPLIRVDPVPILNARPDTVIDANVPQIFELDVSGNTDIDLTDADLYGPDAFGQALNFIFTGTLTGDVTILVPATFNEFTVSNKTTGGFTLYMQIIDKEQTAIELPSHPLLPNYVNDCFTIKIIHQN